MVVLNTPEFCRELFEKRGAIYSDRLNDYIAREHIVCGSQHMLFIPLDGYHKQTRAGYRSLVSTSGASEVVPIQNAAASFLIDNTVLTPEKFQDRLPNWALSTPLTAICGLRGAQKSQEWMELFYGSQKDWLKLLTPGVAPPVEMFPVLKYLPEFLAKWKKDARELRRKQRGYYYLMLNAAEEELRKQNDTPNEDEESNSYEPLMVTLLKQQDSKRGFDDDQLAYLGGNLLDAAVDTTYSSALTFKILGAYPHILKQAQMEVDDLCGSSSPKPQHLAQFRYPKAC